MNFGKWKCILGWGVWVRVERGWYNYYNSKEVFVGKLWIFCDCIVVLRWNFVIVCIYFLIFKLIYSKNNMNYGEF